MGMFDYTLNRWCIPADGSLIQCPLGMGVVVKTVWLNDWGDFEVYYDCDAYYLSNTDWQRREMPDWGNMSSITCSPEEDAEPIEIVCLGILIEFSNGALSGSRAWLLYEDYDPNAISKWNTDDMKLIPHSDTWFSEVRDGWVRY